MGRAFLPSSPPSMGGYALCYPTTSRRLCGLSRPAGGIFAPMSSRAGEIPKRKTAIKAICRPVTAFCALVAIHIFQHRKTAHRSRQRPAHGIKQPRPTPSGVSRGLVICSGRLIAPRSAPPFDRTRRSIYHGISSFPLHRSALYRGRVVSTGRTASAGIVACPQNLLP